MRRHTLLPTAATIRFHRRLLAVAVVLTIVLFAVGLSSAWDGSLRAIGAGLGALGGVVYWRGRLDALDAQRRQLASYGRPFVPLRVRTELAHGASGAVRHVVAAEWMDPEDRQRTAISVDFDYDPYPLLEPARIHVLADPFHPEVALVPEENLPPLRWTRLDPQQQARVAERSAHNPWFAWLIPKLLWAVIIGLAALPFLGLFALKYGWI
jgi:hypothetical protein